MNVFEAVKLSVSTRQAAEFYGLHINRSGMAVCPFHDDKNPSMKVDKRFHCFGCGVDGDVIDFTAKLYGLGLKEAAVKLAEDFSVAYDGRGRASPKNPYKESWNGFASPDRKKGNVTGYCVIISIRFMNGKKYMLQSRRIRNGIPCLWKHCRKRIMWSIWLICCCMEKKRKKKKS